MKKRAFSKVPPPMVSGVTWVIAHGKVNTCDMAQRTRSVVFFSPIGAQMWKDGSECATIFFYSVVALALSKRFLGSLI